MEDMDLAIKMSDERTLGIDTSHTTLKDLSQEVNVGGDLVHFINKSSVMIRYPATYTQRCYSYMPASEAFHHEVRRVPGRVCLTVVAFSSPRIDTTRPFRPPVPQDNTGHPADPAATLRGGALDQRKRTVQALVDADGTGSGGKKIKFNATLNAPHHERRPLSAMQGFDADDS